jgi:hypothetical protein
MNDALVRAAERIALREGKVWTDCLAAARNEAARQQPAPLRKVVDKRVEQRDEALRKKAEVLAHAHRMPGIGDPSPSRRIEIHDVETSVGRLHVQVERDTLTIHGVSTMLEDVDRDLRNALTATAAAFSAATTDIEQTDQRNIIGIIIDGVLRRHQFLNAKVREAVTRQRFDI